MKNLISFLMIFVSQASISSEQSSDPSCSLSIYNPTLQYETSEYQNEFFQTLKSKGYSGSFPKDSPLSFKTRFLIFFSEDGILPIGYTATLQLIDRTNTLNGIRVRYEDSRRTWGRDQGIYFFKMLDSLPRCSNGQLF